MAHIGFEILALAKKYGAIPTDDRHFADDCAKLKGVFYGYRRNKNHIAHRRYRPEVLWWHKPGLRYRRWWSRNTLWSTPLHLTTNKGCHAK
jgi:hypothetical protein